MSDKCDGPFVCDELAQARFKARMLEADNKALRGEVSHWIDQTQEALKLNSDPVGEMITEFVMVILSIMVVALFAFYAGVHSRHLF